MRQLSSLVLASCTLLCGCSATLPTLRLSGQSRRSRVLDADGSRNRRTWHGQLLLTSRWTLGRTPLSRAAALASPVLHRPSPADLPGRLPCRAFCAWERASVRSVR